jgi:hypothetical protein
MHDLDGRRLVERFLFILPPALALLLSHTFSYRLRVAPAIFHHSTSALLAVSFVIYLLDPLGSGAVYGNAWRS